VGAFLARDNWRWPGRQSRLLARLDDLHEAGNRNRIFEYALCLAFLLPMLFGVFAAAKSQRMTAEASGLARDLAHMYRQGVDFSSPANRSLALELARGRGLALGANSGAAILSRVRVVGEADCGHCANTGSAVFEQQIVIGGVSAHVSQLGTPPAEPGTGMVREWTSDPAARARASDREVKPGAPSWICELWFPSPDQPEGVYVRASE
jgi:hypothetical protein